MPVFAMTKGTKRQGLQTYQRAQALPDPLRTVELEYLSVRDAYTNLVARKAQFDEALAQAKVADSKDDIREFSGKIHALESKLVDMKVRVRSSGERSWAEAFFLAADSMLTHDVLKQISEQADTLIGRPRHELRGKQ